MSNEPVLVQAVEVISNKDELKTQLVDYANRLVVKALEEEQMAKLNQEHEEKKRELSYHGSGDLAEKNTFV